MTRHRTPQSVTDREGYGWKTVDVVTIEKMMLLKFNNFHSEGFQFLDYNKPFLIDFSLFLFRYLLFDFRIWSKSDFPLRIGRYMYAILHHTILKHNIKDSGNYW